MLPGYRLSNKKIKIPELILPLPLPSLSNSSLSEYCQLYLHVFFLLCPFMSILRVRLWSCLSWMTTTSHHPGSSYFSRVFSLPALSLQLFKSNGYPIYSHQGVLLQLVTRSRQAPLWPAPSHSTSTFTETLSYFIETRTLNVAFMGKCFCFCFQNFPKWEWNNFYPSQEDMNHLYLNTALNQSLLKWKPALYMVKATNPQTHLSILTPQKN